MKKNYTSVYRMFQLIFISLAFILCSNTSRACVDYHPTIYTTVTLDSSFTQIELVIHNLYLFGGVNGDFCTCAISAYMDLFTNIYFVAFEDSATLTPIPGFTAWAASANATTSWSSVMSGVYFSGFTSAVGASGLPPGTPVVLVIRAALPPGYTVVLVDSAMQLSQLGTDKWDNVGQSLTGAHQSVSSYGTTTYNLVATSYFAGINEADLHKNYFNVWYSSASDDVNIILSNPLDAEIVITDISGKTIVRRKAAGSYSKINLSDFSAGMYFVSVRSEKFSGSKKIIVSR